MKIEINGADLVFIPLLVVMGCTSSAFWLMATVPIVLTWFFSVHWENKRFVGRRR